MTHFSVDLEDVSLSLSQLSDSGKPRLLCVHGGPGLDQKSLQGVDALKDVFDLIFVDLRGHGQSSIPKDDDYSLNAYARDIAQLANKLRTAVGIGVLGHSFGGLIVTQVMAESSSAFDFGILCCSPIDSTYQATAADALKKHVSDIDPDGVEKRFAENPNNDDSYATLMKAYGPMYFPGLARSEIEKIMAHWTFKVAPYNFAERSIFPSFDLRALCHKNNVPMLVIGGRDDDLIPMNHVANFKQHLKRCELGYVDGGHFPFTTHTKEFSLIVSQWWDAQRKEIIL